MQTIRIETTQNIELEYELAGIGDRIIAYLVDMVIYFAYCICMILIYQAFYPLNEWVGLLMFLPVFIYQPACEIFLNGQSLGKKMRNIRVISLDGNQPNIGQYMVRWIFRIVDTMMSSGVVAIVTISLSEKAQRVGDMLAGTTVVRTKPVTGFADTIYAPTGDTYEPRFDQASQLTDADVSLLREVVSRYKKDPGNHGPILIKAYNKTRLLLSINEEYDPLDFLETLIRDYNAITGKAD